MLEAAGVSQHIPLFALSGSCCSCSRRSRARVAVLIFFCVVSRCATRTVVDSGEEESAGGVATLCVGRRARSRGELSRAPVDVYDEAMRAGAAVRQQNDQQRIGSGSRH